MTDEPKVIQEPKAGNPGSAGAEGAGKGSSTPEPNPVETKLAEATEKLEVYKRQLNGSTEEALRLKKERDDLKTQLEQANSRSSKPVDSDEAFEALVKEHGTVGAIKAVLSGVLSPVVTKVDTLFEEKVANIHSSFKAKHPGLASVAEKFSQELERLKTVYSDINEAMNNAYLLCGGLEADRSVIGAQEDEQKKAALEDKSKEDKDKLIESISGGGSDKRTPPTNPEANLEQRIRALEDKALLYSMQGKNSAEIFAQAETLKKQLAAKRKA